MPTDAARPRRRHANIYTGTWHSAEDLLAEVATLEGLEDEIALLRVRLAKWAEQHPEEVAALLPVVKLIVHAVAVQHRISGRAQRNLYDSVAGVLDGIGAALLPEEGDGG